MLKKKKLIKKFQQSKKTLFIQPTANKRNLQSNEIKIDEINI